MVTKSPSFQRFVFDADISGVVGPTVEESLNSWIVVVVTKFRGCPLSNDPVSVSVKHQAVIDNPKDTGEFMGNQHGCHPKIVSQERQGVIQFNRGDRVQSCAWLIQEEHTRLHGQSSSDPCALEHTPRDLRREVQLEAGQPDDPKARGGQGRDRLRREIRPAP